MKINPRILILNDATADALQLQEILKNEKYEDVLITNKGDDAIAMATAFDVDLIFIKLPVNETRETIETVKRILTVKRIPIIYISDLLNEESIANARKTNPSAFVFKPYLADLIAIAIESALNDKHIQKTNTNGDYEINNGIKLLPPDTPIYTDNEAIYVKENYRFVRISLSDILYMQAGNNYTFMFTASHKFIIRKTLQCLLEKINYKQFIRVHRSFVINIIHITAFDDSTIVIGKKEIPLSKNYKESLTLRFNML